MNLKQLKYVITVTEFGSFSKAADVLNISQPSLSQYIKKIEEQIGVELFERSGGNVRVTDAGKIYIDIGRKILDLENQMQNQLMDVSKCKRGTLTIGTSPFRSASFMPEVAALFREKYPGIQLLIREMETRDLLESAERGEFDLCVTNLPVDSRIFNVENITNEEIVVAVKRGCELDDDLRKKSKQVKQNAFPTIDVGLLNHQQFVMLTENQFMQTMINNISYEYNLQVQTSVVVKSIEAQIKMVSKGLGVAFVPSGVKNIADSEKISYYSVAQELPERTLGLIYSKDKYLSEPVKSMIELLKGNY